MRERMREKGVIRNEGRDELRVGCRQRNSKGMDILIRDAQ